jgi:hypothetical protein
MRSSVRRLISPLFEVSVFSLRRMSIQLTSVVCAHALPKARHASSRKKVLYSKWPRQAFQSGTTYSIVKQKQQTRNDRTGNAVDRSARNVVAKVARTRVSLGKTQMELR